MKNPRYSPVFNRKKQKTKKKYLVQVKVYLSGQHRYFSTGIYVLPDQWDEKEWVINHKNADYYNGKIRKTIADLEQYELKARANGKQFTLDDLPSSRNIKITFLQYMDNQIDSSDLAPGTKKQHKATLNHVIGFGKIKHFSDITERNIRLWDDYLHEHINAQSSIYGQHKRLKKWVRMALHNGLIEKDPYLLLTFNPGNRNTIRYLSKQELEKLEKTTMPNAKLDRVRDVFLFCCYTGLAYHEVKNLVFSQISQDDENIVWIAGSRDKVAGNKNTGASGEYFVPLSKRALAIIDKYIGTNGKYLLPVISNQSYNDYLKTVAGICGIDKNLTSHVARHTFATTYTLSKGISIESVSKMLGHASIRMTEKYAKVLKERIREDMKKII